MASRKTTQARTASKTPYHVICVILLQFLIKFSQGQGPGITFSVSEGEPVDTSVGQINTTSGYTYRLLESSPYFTLESSGRILTKAVIDRESLSKDQIHLLIVGSQRGFPSQPVDVYIDILDVNDNKPVFQDEVFEMSIQENSHTGFQHQMVTATDADKGENGTVSTYEILSGNNENYFKLVQPSSLTPFMYLEVIGKLDRETKDSYQLNISASDDGRPILHGYLQVQITITDTNDNNPTFNPSEFEAKINESAPVNSIVTTVHASDVDIGLNAEIDYRLTDETTDQFMIVERTGEIRTKKSPLSCSRVCARSLTRCIPNSCIFTVEASDRGSPSLLGRAYIMVIINDENDHDPVISFTYLPDKTKDFSTVDENVNMRKQVASMIVTDEDSGENGETTVSITGGNELGHFELFTLPGSTITIVRVIGELDRERINMYNLTIKAVDHGYPQRSAMSHLIIYVSDANDHAPVFAKSEYRVRMSELKLPGSLVESVTASDEDSGPNSALTYSIVSGNDLNWFRIDATTGLVTTQDQIDHERVSQVTMNISAKDGGAQIFQNFTTLIVDILDENDVTPTFDQSVYEKSVSEDIDPGSGLVTLTASDNDQGINGTVTYRFHPSVERSYPNTFQIDSRTGKIQTTRELDRETIPKFTLRIIAKDGGNPSLSSTATLIISLTDVNDNAPTFRPEHYYVNVLESFVSPDVDIVQVTAFDPDEGINRKITYSFSGDSRGFKVDFTTGRILPPSKLSRGNSPYVLTVRATDGGGKTSAVNARVEVTVASDADLLPSFGGNSYNFSISEISDNQIPVNRSVGRVSATVADGSRVTYAIVGGDPYGVFSINQQTGQIFAVKKLDREFQAEYNLTVIANGGFRFSDIIVKVEITDINDNLPMFVDSFLETSVYENWPVGRNIYHAEARDDDSGPNSDLTYTLSSNTNNVFMIRSKSGVIYLNKPLDQLPRNRKTFILTVAATDAGTPQLSTDVNVTVHLKDVNDHNPVFQSGHYEKSIHESKPVNELILQLIAVDEDEGRNGELVYNITRGNLEGKFGIFPDGTLYVAHALDREQRDIYALSVTVTDRGVIPRSSVANITFHILDDNDNKPVFSNDTYNFYVRENKPLRTYIGSVRASDADIGRNAEIIFSVRSGPQNFSINPQTGELYSMMSFDREMLQESSNRDYYTFEVTATDNGLKRLKGKALVRVFVTDDNDNAPIFSRQIYTGSISEDARNGVRITTVTATDVDIGENGAISYTFASGNDDEKFRIDETSGEVTLNQQLDREAKDHYNLIILATDSVELNQRLSATATLQITVTDYNDNSPVFVSPPTGKSILESAQPGELIATFSATDADISNNALLIYQISNGNSESFFNLDRHTGKMYLNKQLNYEVTEMYRLVITVSDSGQPRMSSSITFITTVLDVNDNAPKFSSSPLVASVFENTNSGISVYTVTAQDADSGVNGEVSYSIIQQQPSGNNFNIHPTTGLITVNEKLDREVSSEYTLRIMAVDKANDPLMRLSSQKTVRITVLDVNDNAPKFMSANTIPVMSSKPRSVIGQIEAEDPDEGNNGRVRFSLEAGDTNMFSIAPNGQITLLRNIPPTSQVYVLTIMVSDLGSEAKSTTSDFYVLITSSTDLGPIFSQPSYRESVEENKPTQTSVIRVQASSRQSGVRVEYYITQITGSKGRLFTIDKSTGWLTTAEVLDRELLPEFITVNVYAAEIGGNNPRTRSIQVLIQIVDENDTPPRFATSLFSQNVSENLPQGASVMKIAVEDPDTVGTTQLSLNGDSADDFSITQDGTLRTARRLSRSLRRTYAFRVQASDGKQTSASDIQINVNDENDHAPEFSKSFYSFDVPEDTAIGTTVAAVTATDEDEAENGQVTYDLVSDWGRKKFQIDGTLGTLTLINQVDFEEIQIYTLKVSAKDGGSNSKTSTATIYINVKDVNDNTPIFDPMSYSREVAEDVAIGTPLLNVSATDIDSGINSRIRYSLAGGDRKNQFDIGPLNGTIFTTGHLDREDIPSYNLIVIATDQAEPPSDRLSTSATVNIQLKDVNDCHPEFLTPNATWVKENAQKGSVVFQVVADDKDSSLNGQVEYSLASVPGFGYPFTIDRTKGDLRVNTDLDRETTTNYSLSITASDKGQPSLSTTQSLIVHIEDVNDNPPRFLQTTYGKTVAEDIAIGKSLLKVSAVDDDELLNGIIRYYIIGGDDNYDFNLDMSSGELRVQKNLDYEREKKYSLIIQAEDSGVHVVLTATATVIINVTDVNDNAPVFVDSPYIAYVQENAENLPVHMMHVTARDDDSAANNQVTYSILDDKEIFQINGQSGEITVHKKLDREAISEYQLVVVGKDSGSPSLSGTGTIKVHVQDVNDHPPVFDNAFYTGHVRENENAYTSVLKVRATDLDVDDNAEIRYSLKDSMGEKFTIYPDSGEIVTLAMLDREETDMYELVVIATDRGIPSQSASAHVVIHVDDDNDYSPEFEQTEYLQHVLDQTPRGAFVLGVTAVDRDINNNGKVVYSLSGTHSDYFVINQNTGVITAGRPITVLDHPFQFFVKATDQGIEQHSTTVNVRVNVVQINNPKPSFAPFEQNLSIKENSQRGTILTTVTASISSRNGQILYYIAGGNVNRGFGINQLNGSVTVFEGIDYESTKSFELWIEAAVSGSTTVSTYKMMRVTVLDVNDNAPRFIKNFFNTSIKENVPKNTPVKQLTASDLDSGKNGEIVFSIQSGNTNNTFKIDSTSGAISTSNIVDREGVDLYHLVIHATDQGSTKLTATATVTIHILDENDNPPKFTRIYSLSVPENAPINTFVVQVTTSDRDIGDNARSTFELLKHTDKFAIDSNSGNITTIGVLDAEAMERYITKVAAIDENYRVETNVLIRITDVNDNRPEFIEDTLSFDFQERQSPNTVIGRMRATDSDQKEPNNQFIFSLKRPSNLFEVDAETGDISAKTTFHYRHVQDHPLSVNRYALDVVVTDLGTPAMSSENMVIITITDANNYPPEFVEKSYFSAVPENTAPGSHVITVLAVDEKDYGINAEVLYSITGGVGSQYFEIDQDTGSITVKTSPQGQFDEDFVAVVKAMDKGSPPLSSTVEVKFKVTKDNIYEPVFSTRDFEETIAEDKNIGYTIQTFRATDSDLGVNGEVKYLITGGNEDGLFEMVKDSGVLKIAKPLDYDTQKVHFLNITARDRALLYKEATRMFTLRLTDVNDNPPVFNQTSYDAYIPENSPLSTSFFTVHATDADSGANAIIHYSIFGDTSLFSIEKETGILKSKGNLDYEVRDKYTLSVMAHNPNSLRGDNFTMKTVVPVHIHVVGVNEYFPQFERKRYDFRVSESAPINASIGSVLATDQDKGIDGIVYYFLVGSSNLRGFSIDHQGGVIRVAGRPDYESSPQIVLNIMAKNWGSIQGNDTDTCQVYVSIEDANDPPVFVQNEYVASIYEDAQANTLVVKVKATDNDIKPENRNFQYTILGGNTGNRFKIDPTSGEIRTTRSNSFDREIESQYNVTIGAVDSGTPPQTGSVVVRVQLLDVNDNAPYFDPALPVGHITENQNSGLTIFSLIEFTKDDDLPPNQGPYRYTLATQTNKFEVSQQTGSVKTRTSLDREETFEYPLQVVVTDGGFNPQMTSTLTFKVVVDDENDNPPEPRLLTIQLMILEGMSPLGVIADVRPLDKDTTGNYTCSVDSGGSNFNIYQNCDLRVTQALSSDNYKLGITGSDGVPSHSPASYDVFVTINEYTNVTIENSLPVVLSGITSSQFLKDKYPKFTNAVKNAFSTQDSAVVYSLQEIDKDLLVFLAVHKPNGEYVPRTSLESTLSNQKGTIESTATVIIKSTSYNTCMDSQCKNGGKCDSEIIMHQGYSIHDSPALVLSSAQPQVHSFCKCPPSYTGEFCEIAMGPCGDSYCYNGGTCTNDVCHCTPQWTGPTCETDVDECEDSPCVNGGSCVNLDGSFRCDCPDGFHGDVCENTLYCTSMPCFNQGSCTDIPGGFKCTCTYGHFGKLCEKTSKGFAEGSYLEFDALSNLNNTDISLFFATKKMDALLFLSQANISPLPELGFVALEIIKGKVRFSYKFSTDPPKRLEVDAFVSDGNWYRAQVQKVSQGAILKVQQCPSGDMSSCEECVSNNNKCHAYIQDLSFNVVQTVKMMSIGGVKDIISVVHFEGDIQSHDFVGCIHSYEVNGIDMLDETRARSSQGISNSCPRSSQSRPCSCRNNGVCVDEWSHTWCRCQDNFMGDNCEEEWKPLTFTPDVSVQYAVRESVRRDHYVEVLMSRRRRAVDSSSVALTFRTTSSSGNLLYVQINSKETYLWIENDVVKFELRENKILKQNLSLKTIVTSGEWFNLTVTTRGSNFNLSLEGLEAAALNFGTTFDFSTVDVTQMVLSGEQTLPGQKNIPGFDGCILSFAIDEEKIPFDGNNAKYEIALEGDVENLKGCEALCENNPCGDGHTCSVDGANYVCALRDAGSGLQIGVIIVICFFTLLIIAIVIVFIVFKRRGMCRRSCLKSPLKATGSLGNTLGGSQENPDSGYGDNVNEDMITNHIADELMLQKGRPLSTKPDLIGSNVMGRGLPQPMELEDGTVIVENGGGMAHMQPYDENTPECYDLENASSIAPSDIDVVAHYRHLRNGQGPKFKSNPPAYQRNPYGRHGESPLTFGQNGRPGSVSPSMLKPHGSGYPNPHSMNGSAVSVPARNSPHVPNIRRPNSAQAVMRSSPHHHNHRNSPLTNLQMRNTPLSNNFHSSRSNSAHSLGSHHSHTSSSSSAPRVPFNKPARQNKKPPKGLTVQEINRLNARPDKLGQISMAEALSSESGEKKYRDHRLDEQLDSGVLLEPPDSSSEDSGANDSFTCSEFEYDNDRTRNDYDQGMVTSKLPLVHETDENPTDSRVNSDGMDSNGDSFTSTVASSEDCHFNPNSRSNGTFNFDALLNWGPNFDKLVGVFKDIALLPDNEKQTLEGVQSNDYEEYV